MTSTLTHSPAEDLSRFVEGTLDDAGRTAVVAHIADCDECRIVVVDAAEFVEPVVVHSERRWWVAVAAAIPVVIGGAYAWQTWQAQRHDPLEQVIVVAASEPSRPFEVRLSGFPYAARKVMRGGDSDVEWAPLEEKAYEVLQRRGDDPRMQHAKGIAQLIVARSKFAESSKQLADATTDVQKNALEAARKDFVVEQNFAIALLQSAAVRVPNKASYQSDLAAALIETHKATNLDRAVKACDQALKIDSRSQDALFNRAIALRDLSDPKAIAAFKLYLSVDPSSPWADEAKQNIEYLQPSL